MDLFDPIVSPEKLNKSYESVRTSPARVASRELLQETFEKLPKPDGNFVRDFQTTGFDARIWELYLMGLMMNVGLQVARPEERPDFLVTRGSNRVWIEATTANPTQGSSAVAPTDYWSEQEEIAIKLGSALFSKLQKRYWELPHVRDHPLVLAIADFHNPDPIRDSSAPLGRYLWGQHVQLKALSGEALHSYELHPLRHHQVGAKTIPAGFFSQPDVEHISAVLFSNAGTVAKFSRMAIQSGKYPQVKALRFGLAYDLDPDTFMPQPFWYMVGDRQELWEEEAVVFHNPMAEKPLAKNFFGKAIEQFWDGEDYFHVLKTFHPLSSLTRTVIVGQAQERAVENRLRSAADSWIRKVREQLPAITNKVEKIHEQWPADKRRPK